MKNIRGFGGPVPPSIVEYEIGADELVSTAVVRAVSAVDGREPSSLRPLGNVVDTTALDTLFEPQYDGTPRTGGRLSFVYNDCHITIDNGEYLTLQMLEDRFCSERVPEPTDSCFR
ncbi:HalOD1 output domain-containing protein [Haloferax prahovense]|uniref:HalOD1 output domain-containing protein n=1 Tax=Haloferax prahovense TaxID=381852 RepID=UPI003C770A84